MNMKTMSDNKVLLVEDEQILALSLRDQLDQLGYKVIETITSGIEAVQYAQEMLPDLILMDIILQGTIDGVEAARQIQSFYDVPIIYITSHSDHNIIERAKLTQPFGYLMKPIQLNELEATIEMAFYKHQHEKKLRELNKKLQKEISDREQSNMALRSSEERLKFSEIRFRKLVEQSPLGIVVYSPQGRVKFSNEAVKIIHDLTDEDVELIRNNYNILEDDQLESHEIIDHIKRGLTGEAIKIPAIRYDPRKTKIFPQTQREEPCWLEVIIYPVNDDQGNIREVVLIHHDITELKKIEEKLKESEKRFKAIFEQAGVGVALIDIQTGKFIDINQKYCDILGYGRDELMSMTFEEITHPDDLENDVNHMNQLKSGEIKEFSIEKRYFHKNGSLVWGNRTVSPMWKIGEQSGFHIEVVEDITERKQAHEQIKTSLNEKEVLLQEIHHRVRNNMAIASAFLSLQTKRVQCQDDLALIQDSRDRIYTMALVQEKLYRTSNFTDVDFAGFIEDLAAKLISSYADYPNQINLKIQTGEVELNITNAIPCGLLVNELLSNAIKHAFPQGRQGEVDIKLHKDNNTQVILTISDDGVGFPDDIDFKEMDTVGMQIVHSLVKQLNGTIELNRTHGSTFILSFPIPAKK